MDKQTIGILLMAYGSPDSLDQMRAYLLDVRGGRHPTPELVAEITHRYALIGGRSPLLARTREQAESLEAELNRRFNKARYDFRVYVGMRHWDPRIQQAVSKAAADGVRRLIALVLAPHSSMLSTGRYFAVLEDAIRDLDLSIELHRVDGWHDHPGLISALAEQTNTAITLFDDAPPYVIFTAHSLPAYILEDGDPYDAQLNETAQMLARRLGLSPGRWRFCYQSAGASAGPWLGPQIEEVVVDLSRSEERDLLVVPIGFVSDHVEVLYDIDIACRELARRNGARLERSPSLNTHPTFIAALADIVADALPESLQIRAA